MDIYNDNNVYYGGKKLENIDRKTFKYEEKACDKCLILEFSDKNGKYKRGYFILY